MKEKTMKIRSVKYNFVMNVILQLSSFVFPLITLPYITRTLGAIGNGKIAFATSVINYFLMFAQLGIPTYGIRMCAKCRDNKDVLTKTVHEILFINIISVFASFVLLAITFTLVPKLQEEPLLLAVNSVTILLNAFGMEWLYQALEQYQYITIRNILFKIVTIILMFLIIKNPNDYILYSGLTVISTCGSNFINFFHSGKFLTRRRYSNYSFKRHLKPIFVFFALSLSVTIYTNMDIVMLGFMSSESEIGFYNLATKIKLVLAVLVSAMGPVLLPRISYYFGQNNIAESKRLIGKSFELMLILSLPISAFFLCFAPQVVNVLGGNEYMPAVNCMRILMLTIIPLALGNIACMQILAPLGLEFKTVISTIIGAIVNLIINFLLIPVMGSNGAAIGTVATEIVVMIIQVYYARNYLFGVISIQPLVKVCAATAIATLIAYIVEGYLSMAVVLNLIILAALFFVLYFSMLILFREKTAYKYFSQFFGKFNR